MISFSLGHAVAELADCIKEINDRQEKEAEKKEDMLIAKGILPPRPKCIGWGKPEISKDK